MAELQGLQWLKIPTNAVNDPKVFALAENFGCDQITAFGYITALALATASLAPDGELTPYSNAAIASFCGVKGNKKVEKFINSLKKSGIIFEKTEKIFEENQKIFENFEEKNKNFQKKLYFYEWEKIKKSAVEVAKTREREREKKRKQREKQKAEANEENEEIEFVPMGQIAGVPMGVPDIDKIRQDKNNNKINIRQNRTDKEEISFCPSCSTNSTNAKNVEEADLTFANNAKSFCLPLRDGSKFVITEDAIEDFKKAYPDIDVPRELKSLIDWVINKSNNGVNPENATTFIKKWLEDKHAKAKKKIDDIPPAYGYDFDKIEELALKKRMQGFTSSTDYT